MNLENALAQVLQLTSALDPRTAALLFIICAIGEFGVSVPYVLESMWLLIGYHFGISSLSPFHLLGLWLAAQVGRQVGSMTLYRLARFGTNPIIKFYHKQRISRFLPKIPVNAKVLSRINLSSPFSVAFGRLCGLRIPIALMLAVRKKLKTMSLGVLLSSVVWDAIYISLGIAVGATAVLKPIHMFFASLAGLTLIYLMTYVVRRFIRRPQPASDSASTFGKEI